MEWSDVLADPSLQDLPYKIELNEYGSIVMTPASNRHARIQGEVAHALAQAMNSGTILVDCSIGTDKGVKVPDVAWCSEGFIQVHGDETPFAAAPEICVEVVSPSNSVTELDEKKALYFAQGALEVWFCREDETIEFYSPRGAENDSRIAPGFSFHV